MRIGIITTVKHNIGDDYIREGILFLIKKLYNTKYIEFELIHKHSPVTVRKGFEGIRKHSIGKFLDALVPQSFSVDKICDVDVVIQSGAPFYWCHDESHCADNEWYKPLIIKRYSKIKDRVPLINLAVGSCQKYHVLDSQLMFCPKCIDYIKHMFSLSNVTTLRDKFAKKILGNIGLDAPVIPCSSIFAIDNLGIKPKEKEYVVFNYMGNGGHFDLGQKLEGQRWGRIFKEFYYSVKDKERHIFVCHSSEEVELVKRLDAKAEYFYSKTYKDYLEIYSKAKFGILNRIHAAFPLASLGGPSFLVGSDTRARMADEIKIENMFVNDVTAEILHEKYDQLAMSYGKYYADFVKIKEKALEQYMSFLQNTIGRVGGPYERKN